MSTFPNCDKCGKPIQRGEVILFEHHRLHYRCLVTLFQEVTLTNGGLTIYFETDAYAARFRKSVRYDKIGDC